MYINRGVASFLYIFSKIIKHSKILIAESYRIDLQINQYKCIWPIIWRNDTHNSTKQRGQIFQVYWMIWISQVFFKEKWTLVVLKTTKFWRKYQLWPKNVSTQIFQSLHHFNYTLGLDQNIFDGLYQTVIEHLESKCYPNFLTSEVYIEHVQSFQTQESEVASLRFVYFI